MNHNFYAWGIVYKQSYRMSIPYAFIMRIVKYMDLLLINQDQNSETSLSMTDVDTLLNELAATSAFSSSSVRQTSNKRSRQAILHDLFQTLPAFDAAVLTQIILKDIRPVIYPIKTTSSVQSLKNFNSNAVHLLTLSEAFRIWDASGTLGKCYRMQATLEDAINLFSAGASDIRPQVGVPIEVRRNHPPSPWKTCVYVPCAYHPY